MFKPPLIRTDKVSPVKSPKPRPVATGKGAYIYGRPCWKEYGGRTIRSVCVGRGVKPKFYFNLGKRPGTLQGGAIDDVDPFEEPSQTFGLQTGAAYLPPEIVRHIGSFRPEGERVLFPLEERGQMRGVQAGASYLPPEIVRHIGSFRPEGEDDFFETSTEGTRTRRGEEISSAAENRSYIMHRLLSLDDDFFEDEEERAPNYTRALRTIIRKAGEIRSKPHFNRRYWQDRLRRTGGVEMPEKMPGPSEYSASASVR